MVSGAGDTAISLPTFIREENGKFQVEVNENEMQFIVCQESGDPFGDWRGTPIRETASDLLFLNLSASYWMSSVCGMYKLNVPGVYLVWLGTSLYKQLISMQSLETPLLEQMYMQLRAWVCVHVCAHTGSHTHTCQCVPVKLRRSTMCPRVSRALAGVWTQMGTVRQRTLFLGDNSKRKRRLPDLRA